MAQESWKNMEEETGRQPPEGPIPCANNCGFFGSSATMNMCSKCYRDHVLTQAQPSFSKADAARDDSVFIRSESSRVQNFESLVVAERAAACPSSSGGAPGGADALPGPSGERPQQPLNRCFSCRKRVGLTGFKCRCGYVFCSLHRYAEKHECGFDYKSLGRQAIAKANPVVKADKVQKF